VYGKPFTVTAAPPAPLAIVSPAGGVTWAAGSAQQIKWTGGSSSWPMTISVINGSGSQVLETLTSNAANNGAYSWTVNLPAGSYLMYVQGDAGKSDSNWVYGKAFTVTAASATAAPPAPLAIVSPAGGETWQAGSTQQIKWTGGNSSWPMMISVVNGAGTQVLETLTSNAANTGAYNWTLNMSSGSYLIYVQGDRGQPDSAWVYGKPFTIAGK
jgi:hypothetical protein